MMRQKIDVSTLPKFPDLRIEKRLWKKGWERIGGIDEAGRGALAGPVAAAIVVLPNIPKLARILAGVRDSKEMTARQREAFEPLIKETSLSWSVAFSSPQEIDKIGILPATRLAALRAIQSLSLIPNYLITDYLVIQKTKIPQEKFIKGDRRSLTIASASVLAKTARDALMRELDAEYSEYGFAQHKGYGTRQHREAIKKMGRCPVHRKSFRSKDEP